MLGKALLSASASAAKVYVEDVMSTFLYTGNGSTQTITNGIDLSGEGGLVWFKGRTDATNHFLQDSAVGWNKVRRSNTTSGDSTISYVDPLSNGFTWYGDNWGDSGIGVVFWTFRKAAKFFDVVTYTGTGSARTVAHNLGSVPGTIIIKRTDSTDDWLVYHRSVGATKGLYLNDTSAEITASTFFNNTEPTSTVFTVGTNTKGNASGGTYVAYLFAHDAGGFGDSGDESVVKCGSYTGNGSATGPVIDLGWEPQWILVKRTSTTGNWYLFDSMRGIGSGTDDAYLYPNLSDQETSSAVMALAPTGFAVETASVTFNQSGGTYIYIAIRRGPMKTPTVGTEVFEPVSATLSSGSPTISTASVVVNDALFTADRNMAGAYRTWQARLTGGNWLDSASTGAETSSTYTVWDLMSRTKPYNYNDGTQITYNFRRAPGFFDVVAYTGNGSSSQSVTHNLTVKPQLIIIKRRSAGTGQDMGWHVFVDVAGTGYWFLPGLSAGLNLPGAAFTGTVSSSAPNLSATTFRPNEATLSTPGGFTSDQTYIAYLFATLTGISKVGSYTGTGTTLSVDCGFTNGARFVLIKRTDSTGDWYVWDTARGIVSGDDPYLLLNSTAAEVTNTDYIDPLSSGFQISSTAPAAINANGGSFIFLAIA